MNNVVTTLAPSFLIGSSSFLQATSKPVISRMGLKFSRIRPGTYQLAALERLEKIPIDLQWEKCCDHSSSFNLEWIFLILAYNKNNYKGLDDFEFRQDPITHSGVSSP